MNSLSQRLRSPWFLASLAWIGFLLVFFFPVVFQGKVIAPLDILDHLMRPWSDGAGGFGVHNAFTYDAISQYLPYDWTVCQSLKQDGYIGWNPYVYGGYALLENTMLCPGDWHHQLYRFFDFWTAWNLGIILQFAIAGAGMLWMLRKENASVAAALLGAVCFAFYSQHTIWIYHRWVLGASCWFPWMVGSIRQARRKERIIDPLSILFTALAFRGGHLQACLFVVLLVSCLFLDDAWSLFRNGYGMKNVRFWGFYLSLSLCSSLLTLDVLLDTIPPLLAGCAPRVPKPFVAQLKTIPHLGTLLLPSLFGSPQTMDIGKVFGANMLETKFIGCFPFLLASFALAHRKAPLAAKLCFILSLLATLTPLVAWLYSRSTVVFAFGCAWLAAWSMDHVDEVLSAHAWRWIARGAAIAIAAWAMVGMALVVWMPRLLTWVHSFVERSIPPDRMSRHDWLLSRTDAFVSTFPPWMANNIGPISLACFGLFAVWRFSQHQRAGGNHGVCGWIFIVILCAFGELFAWSRTWITFSRKPNTAETGTLYPVPDWAARLRSEMSDGGFLWMHGGLPDFDYFQINAQSGIGISCLQGYETVAPFSLKAPDASVYDPFEFASRGVSHVLVLPGAAPPSGLSAWTEVIHDEYIHLYRNPAFQSRFMATLSDGTVLPLFPTTKTINTICLTLPARTSSIRIAQPWHRKWSLSVHQTELPSHFSASLGKGSDGSFQAIFNKPLTHETKVVFAFNISLNHQCL